MNYNSNMNYIDTEERLFNKLKNKRGTRKSKKCFKAKRKETSYTIKPKNSAPYLWCDDIYEREIDSYIKHTKSRRNLVRHLNTIEEEFQFLAFLNDEYYDEQMKNEELRRISDEEE